jgi:hypothetical protein
MPSKKLKQFFIGLSTLSLDETYNACTRTPQKACGVGGLDSQRSGAEMGDSRSGMLLRPITPPKWLFSWFWVTSVS